MKALIFDFDGTIVDTEYNEFVAWQTVYQAHGAELALSYWLPAVGNNDGHFSPAQNLCDLLGQKLDKTALQHQADVEFGRLNHSLKPNPGVLDYLEQAPKLGMRLGLASSSSRPWVQGHLQRLGLWERFEVVCTKEQVERTKPHPALFEQAAAALGIASKQAIALEDSLNGVRAAKAAGCYTVAIPNRLTQHLDLSQADLILPSLDSLSLKALLAKIHA